MKIVDRTHLSPGSWNEPRSRTDYCLIHRALWIPGDQAWRVYGIKKANTAGVIKLHQKRAEEKGHNPNAVRSPYTFLLSPDMPGMVEQAAPLDALTWHALQRSREALSIAVLWDPQILPLPDELHDRLVTLMAYIMGYYPHIKFSAHDSLAAARQNDRKACPGKHLNVFNAAQEARKLRDKWLQKHSHVGAHVDFKAIGVIT